MKPRRLFLTPMQDQGLLHSYEPCATLKAMCRSIKVLRGRAPTDDDVSKAALQFVRKVSGFQKPSKANIAAFERAIAEVAAATQRLLDQVEKGTAPTRVPARRSVMDESTACD